MKGTNWWGICFVVLAIAIPIAVMILTAGKGGKKQ